MRNEQSGKPRSRRPRAAGVGKYSKAGPLAPARDFRAPYVVGFYLVPEFPMMAFASAIEPLRSANRARGETLFEWRLYSRDGAPVRASNGIDISVHGAVDDGTAVDLLLVCAGTRDAGARS